MSKRNRRKTPFKKEKHSDANESNAENESKSIEHSTNNNPKNQTEEKKAFYERKPWPALSFFIALALAIVNIIFGSSNLYDKFRGAKFKFEFESSEYNILGSPFKPNGMFFIIRGDVFNEGKKPLRIREFALDIKFEDKWIPLKIMNMPDSIVLGPSIDDFSLRTIYRKNLQWLEDIAQVDADQTQNGHIYAVVDSGSIKPFQLMLEDTLEFKIHCLETNFDFGTTEFLSIKGPRSARRLIE